MATIEEILRMSQLDRTSAYKANGIETVTIDGNEFSDYGAFSFIWEKSYVKSPERSANGSIGNLDSYPTFITPHLKIDFSMMSIDSYRKLMSLIYMKKEFKVTCYDVVNNRITTNLMYFSTEEMPKLWTIVEALNGNENAVELLGIQEYTVEMIGTNNLIPNPEIQVWYKNSDGTEINTHPYIVYDGEDFEVGTYVTNPPSKWMMENGLIVSNGDVITLHVFGKTGMSNVTFIAIS
jgi:hypothetical protein